MLKCWLKDLAVEMETESRTRVRIFLPLPSGDYTSHIPSCILYSRCHFEDEKGEWQKSSRHNTELSEGDF